MKLLILALALLLVAGPAPAFGMKKLGMKGLMKKNFNVVRQLSSSVRTLQKAASGEPDFVPPKMVEDLAKATVELVSKQREAAGMSAMDYKETVSVLEQVAQGQLYQFCLKGLVDGGKAAVAFKVTAIIGVGNDKAIRTIPGSVYPNFVVNKVSGNIESYLL